MQPDRAGLAVGLLVLLVLGAVVVPSAVAARTIDGPPVGTVPSSGSGCGFPVTATDATGTQVTIDSRPQRIVTLCVSADHTMWEIGGKGRVVAVTSHAAYLSGAPSLPTIATYPSVDVESVVGQSPDLVLAPNIIGEDDVTALRRAGLTVYRFEEAETVEDIYAKTVTTGRLTGACDGAEATVDWMQGEMTAIRDAVRGRERPAVFYHLGGGWTAGSGTFIDELVSTAGGRNVATEAGIHSYAVMSGELILTHDPEWIVRTGAPVPNALPYSETTAVEEGQIVEVDPNHVNQPAPRTVFAVAEMATAFHPDAEIDVAGSGAAAADLTRRAPRTRGAVTADGVVTLGVADLYGARSVSIAAPDGGASVGNGVSLVAVNLSLARPNPAFELAVGPNATLPEGEPIADAVVLGAFAVVPNGLLDADVASVRFRLRLDRGVLDRAGVGPGAVTVSRHDGRGWTRLGTRLAAQDASTFTVVATAPGTSVFAVTVPRTASVTTEARLVDPDLAVGDPVVVETTVTNPGVTAVTVPLELSIGGSVAAVRAVRVPPNGTRTVRLEATAVTAGTHRVSVGSRSVGTITVRDTRTAAPASTTTDRPTLTGATPARPGTAIARSTEDAGTATATPGQPGFGVVVAAVGLLGGIALARRRWRP